MASRQKKPAIDAHSDRGVIVELRQSPAILSTVLAEKLAASTAMMAPDDDIELKAARRAKLDCLVVGPLCTSKMNQMRDSRSRQGPTSSPQLCVSACYATCGPDFEILFLGLSDGGWHACVIERRTSDSSSRVVGFTVLSASLRPKAGLLIPVYPRQTYCSRTTYYTCNKQVLGCNR